MKPSENATGNDVVEPTHAKPDRSDNQRHAPVGSVNVDELIANYLIRQEPPEESSDSGGEHDYWIVP
jgi:hypothetical protein